MWSTRIHRHIVRGCRWWWFRLQFHYYYGQICTHTHTHCVGAISFNFVYRSIKLKSLKVENIAPNAMHLAPSSAHKPNHTHKKPKRQPPAYLCRIHPESSVHTHHTREHNDNNQQKYNHEKTNPNTNTCTNYVAQSTAAIYNAFEIVGYWRWCHWCSDADASTRLMIPKVPHCVALPSAHSHRVGSAPTEQCHLPYIVRFRTSARRRRPSRMRPSRFECAFGAELECGKDRMWICYDCVCVCVECYVRSFRPIFG